MFCGAWSGSNLLDTQMVFLKEFFKKYDFEKKNQQTKKSMKIFPGGKELKAHAQLPSNAGCAVFDLDF